jgi:co-chaperonin GroES (HSP10)
MHFRPLNDRVVVRRVDADEKTAGGIIIPESKPRAGPTSSLDSAVQRHPANGSDALNYASLIVGCVNFVAGLTAMLVPAKNYIRQY